MANICERYTSLLNGNTALNDITAVGNEMIVLTGQQDTFTSLFNNCRQSNHVLFNMI